jgi:hypothetical protein
MDVRRDMVRCGVEIKSCWWLYGVDFGMEKASTMYFVWQVFGAEGKITK